MKGDLEGAFYKNPPKKSWASSIMNGALSIIAYTRDIDHLHDGGGRVRLSVNLFIILSDKNFTS